MPEIETELSFDTEIVRPSGDSFAFPREIASDSMREGDLGLGAVGPASAEV